MTTKQRAIEICNNLNMTLNRMGDSDGVHSDNPMFKQPRPKRSTLASKRRSIIIKYSIKKSELWEESQHIY